MELKEITLTSERVFEGGLLKLDRDTVALPDGASAPREVVRHPGGVCVLPLHRDNTVSVVRQFRYPYRQVLLEVPAGKLEPGEDPAGAIRRELSEEAGLTAGEWIFLGRFYPSPGYTDEVIHLYLARDLKAGAPHPDAGEFLTPDRIPLDELTSMVMAGEIPDGKTMTLILMARRFLEQEAEL